MSELNQNVTFQEEQSHQTPDLRLVDGHDSENEEHRDVELMFLSGLFQLHFIIAKLPVDL